MRRVILDRTLSSVSKLCSTLRRAWPLGTAFAGRAGAPVARRARTSPKSHAMRGPSRDLPARDAGTRNCEQ